MFDIKGHTAQEFTSSVKKNIIRNLSNTNYLA